MIQIKIISIPYLISLKQRPNVPYFAMSSNSLDYNRVEWLFDTNYAAFKGCKGGRSVSIFIMDTEHIWQFVDASSTKLNNTFDIIEKLDLGMFSTILRKFNASNKIKLLLPKPPQGEANPFLRF